MSLIFASTWPVRPRSFRRRGLAAARFLLIILIVGGCSAAAGSVLPTHVDTAEVEARGQVLVDVLAKGRYDGTPRVEVTRSPDGVWVSASEDGLLIDVSDYIGAGDFDVMYRVTALDPENGEEVTVNGEVDVHVNAPTDRNAGTQLGTRSPERLPAPHADAVAARTLNR